MTAPLDLLSGLRLESGKTWGSAATELQRTDAATVLALGAEHHDFGWFHRRVGLSVGEGGACRAPSLGQKRDRSVLSRF